jgi:integrase
MTGTFFRRVVWGINTGMDHEDIKRITWGDITKDYNLWTYRSKLVRDGAKKDFQIPLNAEVRAILKEIRAEVGITPADVPIFKRKSIVRLLGGAVNRAKLYSPNPAQNIAFKTLRHMFASHLAIRGRHPKEVADLMGHSRLEQTMTYMHLAPSKTQEVVESLQGLTGVCQKSDRFLAKNAEESRQY